MPLMSEKYLYKAYFNKGFLFTCRKTVLHITAILNTRHYYIVIIVYYYIYSVYIYTLLYSNYSILLYIMKIFFQKIRRFCC